MPPSSFPSVPTAPQPSAGGAGTGRPWTYAALYLLACVSVEALTSGFNAFTDAKVPWNPSPGLSVVYVMLSGWRAIPVVALATLLAEGWSRPAEVGATAYVAVELGRALIHAGLGLGLRLRPAFAQGRPGPRDVNAFVLAAALAAFGAATLQVVLWGEAAGSAGGSGPAAPLLRATVADLLGLIVVTPLAVLTVRRRWREALLGRQLRPAVLRDLGLFALATTLLLLLVFRVKPFDEFRMFYLLFLPMIAVATRYGLAGVAATLPLVQLGLIVSLAWAVVRAATIVEFQLLMLALSITALYLGALADGHRDALAAVQRHEVTLRQQQRALEQTLRAAGASEMASALAHELNQPLSAIGTYARVCRMQLDAPDFDRGVLAATLEKVSREAARGGEFVRRMRDFFRSGSTRLERCEVAAIVQSALDAVADRAAAGGIAIAWDPPRGPLPVLVDRMQAETVLHNLLTNAIDAAALGGSPRLIEVRALPAGDGATIEVADSGPGIAAELGEQLFAPLATTKPHGMGLGLAISRSIATALGGELWLATERERTTFCLRLPNHADE